MERVVEAVGIVEEIDEAVEIVETFVVEEIAVVEAVEIVETLVVEEVVEAVGIVE